MQSLSSQIGYYARMQAMLLVMAVAGGAAFYLLGYRLTAGRLSRLEQQIDSARRELATSNAKAAEVPQLSLQVEKMQTRLERRSKKLPRQPELGQFIKDLTQVGQQSSLRGLAVQPQGSRRLELFFELPIFMRFEGEFPNAAMFLRQIEDLQRLTRVQRLNVKTKNEETGAVEVELTMNIFFAEGQ